MKYILASASPRRKELFKLICEDFDVVVSDVEEVLPDDILAEDAPVYLSGIKADAVAKQFPNDIVIGADTSVILNGIILGKPKGRDDAFNMLSMLSGKVHSVITGCTIVCNSYKLSFSRKTEVEFYNLSDDEINAYIDTDEVYDKAGSYAVQGYGSLLVKNISGDYFNVVGLPVAELKRNIDKIKQLIK